MDIKYEITIYKNHIYNIVFTQLYSSTYSNRFGGTWFLYEIVITNSTIKTRDSSVTSMFIAFHFAQVSTNWKSFTSAGKTMILLPHFFTIFQGHFTIYSTFGMLKPLDTSGCLRCHEVVFIKNKLFQTSQTPFV